MSTTDQRLADRIEIDAEIMAGKPVIRGTRIPVDRVLRHLQEHDRADVFRAFPELTDDDVRACVAYARQAVAVLHPVRPSPSAA